MYLLFRTAMPYGGYEKASKRMTFQMPKFDLGPLLSEPLGLYNQNLSNRPSFNRTPIPWLSSGEPVDYNVDIGIPLDGETEELWGVSSSTLHPVSPLWFQFGERIRSRIPQPPFLWGMEGRRREKSAFSSVTLSPHSKHPSSPAQSSPSSCSVWNLLFYGICSPTVNSQ